MNPSFLKVNIPINKSFSIREDKEKQFYNQWHFHPELELVFIKKGQGTLFIGSRIERFKPNDIVLIGENLPHLWKSDSYERKAPLSHAIALHFNKDFLGSLFFELSETISIKNLFPKAKRGVVLKGTLKKNVATLLESMLTLSPLEQILQLIKILSITSNSKDITVLLPAHYTDNYSTKETDRINRIYNYTIKNLTQKITINDLAKLTNFTPISFCRYFKKHTKKSYITFVNELRINYSCELITKNPDISIKEVCCKVGYNNRTHFNNFFFRFMKITPTEYQDIIKAQQNTL